MIVDIGGITEGSWGRYRPGPIKECSSSGSYRGLLSIDDLQHNVRTTCLGTATTEYARLPNPAPIIDHHTCLHGRHIYIYIHDPRNTLCFNPNAHYYGT